MRPHMEIARYARYYGLAVKVDNIFLKKIEVDNIVTALPKSWCILNGDHLKEYGLCLIRMERERMIVFPIYSKTNTRPNGPKILCCS